MAGATFKEAEISIKVMVQKGKNKVIFAEAENNFVDILFSFLTLPLGTIVRILEECPDTKDVALRGIKNLYQSLKDLPSNYFSTEESKYILLNPRNPAYDLCRKLKINIDDTEPLKYFFCRNGECYGRCGDYSHCKLAKCGKCGDIMDREIKFRNSTTNNTGGDQVNGGVFVSELTTFIVRDDLRLMPHTVDTCVQLLSDYGITDASQLEERTINVGRDQILAILKAALLSSLSLTHLVFPRTQLKRGVFGSLYYSFFKNEVKTSIKRMKLKVTLQKSTSMFLFAEVEEDFVDFIFGFLGIPLGVVVGKLMNGYSSLVSFDNLFKSISSFGVEKSFESKEIKDLLLEPTFLKKHLSQNQNFSLKVLNESFLYLHNIGSSFSYRTYLHTSSRPLSPPERENILIIKDSKLQSHYERVCCLVLKDPRDKGIFMKTSAKFMLMDDLFLTPLSFFSTISLLNKLEVGFNDVETHELSIGIKEGLEVLKASLCSSGKCLSPLTNSLLKEHGVTSNESCSFGHAEEESKFEVPLSMDKHNIKVAKRKR